MKIFLLTSQPLAPPWNGGDKNLARTLVLGAKDVDFTFFGGRHDPSPWPAQHRRLLLDTRDRMPTTIEKLRVLAALAGQRHSADAVHMIITLQNRFTPFVLRNLPLVRSSPWIATCPTGRGQPLRLLQAATVVVAISRRTARQLQRAGLMRVRHIPPGVDLHRFQPDEIEEGWKQLNIGEGPFVLFAGHHDDGGGLEAALDVVAQLRQRVRGVRLITAMRYRPSQQPEQLRRTLVSLASARGMRGAVVQLSDIANMRAAILASHATLFQPHRLGLKMELPLTLIESLASGRPVVVSDVDALSEIGEGPGVAVCRPRDPAVIDHLERLLTDSDYFQTCSVAARGVATQRYDAAEMVESYRELYRDVA